MIIPDKIGIILGIVFVALFVLSIIFRDKGGGPPDYDNKGENYRDTGSFSGNNDNGCSSDSGSGSCGGDGGRSGDSSS